MENNSQSKYVLVVGIILVLAGLFYFFNLKNSKVAPYQVLAPESYETGTTVSLYKETPTGFPKEVVLENKTLSYSGTVTTAEGKTQTKVSYQSEKSVPDVLALYKETLPKNGWQIVVNVANDKVASLLATKGAESVVITIGTIKELGTTKDIGALVTFQYEK